MHYLSEKIIKKNGLERVIQVVKGRVEEIELDEKVDVIVSEWMGFYLLHESMLSSVLVARDRFLSEDGVILPSSATLYAAPTSLLTLRRKIDKTWKDMYGFDFSPVADGWFNSQSQPLTDIIPESDIVANAHTLTVINLKYADKNDFDDITSSLTFKIDKPNVLRGVVLWFDVSFTLHEDDETSDDEKLILSTSPYSQPTHWKQTTIPLPTSLLVSQGDTFECRWVFWIIILKILCFIWPSFQIDICPLSFGSLNLRRDVDDTDPEGRRYKLTLVLPEDVEMLNGGDASDDDINNVSDDINNDALHLILQALNK